MIAYLDSSAIAKLYLDDELGTEPLREVIAGSDLATSRLSYVEVRAGFAAARRANRIAPRDHESAIESFEAEWPGYVVIELSEEVSRRAGVIAELHGLRAGDAIQVASALALDFDDVLVVAWDHRLRSSASLAGLAVFPAEV